MFHMILETSNFILKYDCVYCAFPVDPKKKKKNSQNISEEVFKHVNKILKKLFVSIIKSF